MKFDMILVHAPSVYDFRERDDVLFAYLSNSDSVHISPIFEMPPVGIFAIKQHLQQCGWAVEFFNIASQMVRHADFDVEAFFKNVSADYIGIDLHWQVHAHGALELCKLYKQIHPAAMTVLGGIASTYYHQELIEYPQVDYVVRGYDTLLPVELLMKARNAPETLAQVPNLSWKNEGESRHNPLTYAPRVFSAAVDWRKVLSGDRKGMTPYNLVIPQAGCEYSCRWCGGSRYFFAKYMGLDKGPARVQKTAEALKMELRSLAEATPGGHTVTMIDFWHEYPALFEAGTDVFVDEKIDCVHFSLHRLPSVEKGRRMAAPVNAVIELSPDSHDLEVAKASGRGKYTMEEMENFIDALLDNVYAFEIYFMLGLPKQTRANIMETVAYCEHLLEKYQGRRVTPFVCPMLPFLDSGSEIYDNADQWGYTIFHRTLEEHRQALLSTNWRDRLNYETQWLSRQELVDSSYDAVRALALLKHKYGVLPKAITSSIVRLIDTTRELLAEIDAHATMPEGEENRTIGVQLKEKIRDYNRNQFRMIRSQQRPVDLGFSRQQWFDTEEAFAMVVGEPSIETAGMAV
jgi:clorobiocin biosynthesis protein CloN6